MGLVTVAAGVGGHQFCQMSAIAHGQVALDREITATRIIVKMIGIDTSAIDGQRNTVLVQISALIIDRGREIRTAHLTQGIRHYFEIVDGRCQIELKCFGGFSGKTRDVRGAKPGQMSAFLETGRI